MSQARYTVTLDAYIWADSDDEARLKSKQLAEKLNKAGDDDHRAQVLELHSTPFGSLTARKIDK